MHDEPRHATLPVANRLQLVVRGMQCESVALEEGEFLADVVIKDRLRLILEGNSCGTAGQTVTRNPGATSRCAWMNGMHESAALRSDGVPPGLLQYAPRSGSVRRAVRRFVISTGNDYWPETRVRNDQCVSTCGRTISMLSALDGA